MGQLHDAFEVTHLAGEHQPGAGDEALLEEFRIEEGRGHLGVAVAQGDDEVFAAGLPIGPAQIGLLDLPDERDVLALLRRIVVLAAHRHALAVFAGIVAQQVVDGADAEDVLERFRRLGAEHRLEAVGEDGHGYSTPISSGSPRWPVR